ncbi:hypothetical protein [Streptomyces sp. NPDC059168]|uniref:hypothetical protein n=1 Tax=Streptomyces sp. NPDC059168 TaxID=3346753 RepID=UPI00369C3954
MSSSAAVPETRAGHSPGSRRLALVGGSLGNLAEWCDWCLHASFAIDCRTPDP